MVFSPLLLGGTCFIYLYIYFTVGILSDVQTVVLCSLSGAMLFVTMCKTSDFLAEMICLDGLEQCCRPMHFCVSFGDRKNRLLQTAMLRSVLNR